MRFSPLVILMVVSAIWGLTWIAIKIGVDTTPPLFFAATRFVAAGMFLGLLFRRRIEWRQLHSRFGKLLIVSVLLTTLCYGPLFWGMRYTPSGLAAIINLSLLPVGLLVVGTMLRVERFTMRKLAGVVLGVSGLIVLFAPELGRGQSAEAAGMAAIAGGTLSACLGSVLARRWFSDLRAGLYAFIAPIVALVSGFLVLGERLEPVQLAASAVLVAAAAVSLQHGAPRTREATVAGCAARKPQSKHS